MSAAVRRALVAAVVLFFSHGGGQALADPQNHLNTETSPYLQLHASDPVYWRPWTEEVLGEAKKAGKPILLSIGYTACHWCHVMQKESYSDPKTADLINKLFFPILVDREDRPDLDTLFQNAAVLMDLPGGWPLTVFLTPDAKPFFGGTYYPPEPRGGALSFSTILRKVSQIYAEDPQGIAGQAARVTDVLGQMSERRPGEITPKIIDAGAAEFLKMIDPLTGGFGEAPKFPQWVALETLWRAGLRTREKKYMEAVTLTLDNIVRGGLYDHVGGGFFRYVVDAQWRVPHFEKMLDVNSALLGLMVEVWRETKDPLLARRIAETANFLLNNMLLAGGGFASSLDADSKDAKGEEKEGAFYTFSANEIDKVLGPDAARFRSVYDITATEGKYLDTADDPGTLYMLEDGPNENTRPLLAKLKAYRAGRPRPRRDDKVLADWNGMAVIALTEASLAFGRRDWLAAAEKAFAFVDENLRTPEGYLAHSWRGKAGGPTTLTGLGLVTAAAVTLYEATGNKKYLKTAEKTVTRADQGYWDTADGGYFVSAKTAGPVVVRAKPYSDNPNMSGNAEMAKALARLYYLTGDTAYRERADKTLLAFGGRVQEPEFGHAGLLNAADTLLTALQVVVVGARKKPGTEVLLKQVTARSLPSRVLEVIKPGEKLPEGHPAQYKKQVDGLPTAYVCRGTVCSLPATDRLTLDETLVQMR